MRFLFQSVHTAVMALAFAQVVSSQGVSAPPHADETTIEVDLTLREECGAVLNAATIRAQLELEPSGLVTYRVRALRDSVQVTECTSDLACTEVRELEVGDCEGMLAAVASRIRIDQALRAAMHNDLEPAPPETAPPETAPPETATGDIPTSEPTQSERFLLRAPAMTITGSGVLDAFALPNVSGGFAASFGFGVGDVELELSGLALPFESNVAAGFRGWQFSAYGVSAVVCGVSAWGIRGARLCVGGNMRVSRLRIPLVTAGTSGLADVATEWNFGADVYLSVGGTWIYARNEAVEAGIRLELVLLTGIYGPKFQHDSGFTYVPPPVTLQLRLGTAFSVL